MKHTLLTIGGMVFCGLSSVAQTAYKDTLFYTGSEQIWTVPCGATNIQITTYGAKGAAGSTLDPTKNNGGLAGLGNKVTATWPNLTANQTLYVYVGGGAVDGVGGYNGGGDGIAVNSQNPSGGGGGATDVRFPGNSLSDRVQVSGGGGGGGNASLNGDYYESENTGGGDGGNGGGNQLLNGNSLSGGDGETFSGLHVYPGGAGGTDTSAGVYAEGCAGYLGASGQMGNGHVGGAGGEGNHAFGSAEHFYAPSGGAGGGGYVGGNGGGGGSAGTTSCAGNSFGSGGGGSAGTNYFDGTPDLIENGVNDGNGYVVISYTIFPVTATVTIDENFMTPCAGDSVVISASPSNGTWSTVSGPNAINNGEFTPTQAGVYEISYTFCAISDTITIDVDCTLGLEKWNDNNFKLFPNPAADYMRIENANGAAVSILDLSGKEVMAVRNYTGEEISVSSLTEGVYMIRIEKDHTTTTNKFVKH